MVLGSAVRIVGQMVAELGKYPRGDLWIDRLHAMIQKQRFGYELWSLRAGSGQICTKTSNEFRNAVAIGCNAWRFSWSVPCACSYSGGNIAPVIPSTLYLSSRCLLSIAAMQE